MGGLLCETLPECPHPRATAVMFLLATRLTCGPDTNAEAHRTLVANALPCLCEAVCRALATQAHLSELHELVGAATLLTSLAIAMSAVFIARLEAGLAEVGVSLWSREAFLK